MCLIVQKHCSLSTIDLFVSGPKNSIKVHLETINVSTDKPSFDYFITRETFHASTYTSKLTQVNRFNCETFFAPIYSCFVFMSRWVHKKVPVELNIQFYLNEEPQMLACLTNSKQKLVGLVWNHIEIFLLVWQRNKLNFFNREPTIFLFICSISRKTFHASMSSTSKLT